MINNGEAIGKIDEAREVTLKVIGRLENELAAALGEVDDLTGEVANTIPLGGLDRVMQDVFQKHGPERDRLTDWRKCQVEPWWSLAAVLSR